ncbi:MAG TPA: alpha/beta fold hydrolase [Gemmataceae bacterium]|jgi:triacylglycerol lipase|nr:alpha/beta fold hydrolase [Gemmataceae bacterium]
MVVPRLRSPIVLVPGLLGFDRLRLGHWTLVSYFSGLPEALSAAGNRVLTVSPSPTAGVAERASQLKAFLDRHAPGEPVHILGHSMGGLDSRYMISRLGMAPRVLSLTTIATPHRGSPFADWGVRRLRRLVKPVLDWFSLPGQAFYDLTTANCRVFNEQVPNAAGVRYFSVAGRYQGDWRRLEWQLSHRIVTKAEGPNDGLVSLASATHGESTEVWEGDHLSLVNWPNPVAQVCGHWRDYTPQYAGLVRRLADEGF